MFKFTTLATLLLGLVATIQANDVAHNAALRSADQNLMQFMLRSSVLSQENPQRSLTCFDYYVPLLQSITNEYETSYAACLAAASDSRDNVDSSTKGDRDAIQASAQGACSALDACNSEQSAIPYFECYVNAGSENTKVLYGIQQNSSTVLDAIREEYRLIENVQNRCTNASERAYVQNTANTYEELQSCLQGKTPVPTTTTTTTQAPAPEPTSTTTQEPEPEPEPQPDPEPEPEPEPEPVPTPQPELEPQPELQPQPEQ